MNKVILIGRLCNDVELRRTQSGTAFAAYRLAVDKPPKSDGTREADFFGCVTWGKAAEFAARHLRKGTKVAVEGRLQSRSYEDKDGKKVTVVEVNVINHEFCESKRAESDYSAASLNFTEVEDDGDLPF